MVMITLPMPFLNLLRNLTRWLTKIEQLIKLEDPLIQLLHLFQNPFYGNRNSSQRDHKASQIPLSWPPPPLSFLTSIFFHRLIQSVFGSIFYLFLYLNYYFFKVTIYPFILRKKLAKQLQMYPCCTKKSKLSISQLTCIGPVSYPTLHFRTFWSIHTTYVEIDLHGFMHGIFASWF